MNSAYTTAHPHADLELVEDGVTLVALTFGVELFTNQSFYRWPKQLLKTFDLFCEICPADQLGFYATETTKVHKPVTRRALGMLGSWLAEGAQPKHYLALELKAAASAQDAPANKFEVWAADASKQSNVISLALPSALAQDQPEAMLAWVLRLAEAVPFRSGLAGYAFECSRYNKRASETHAWSLSTRHPGVDIVRLPYDAKAVDHGTLKGVSWLTLLDRGLFDDLGGMQSVRARLSSEVEILETSHGFILKAGPAPALGDVTCGDVLPLYREVYGLLAPWITRAAEQSMSFSLGGNDYVERTEAWYARHGV